MYLGVAIKELTQGNHTQPGMPTEVCGPHSFIPAMKGCKDNEAGQVEASSSQAKENH